VPIQILLVEDHVLVRAGIRALLQRLADVVVVGEASTGREALALAGTLHPDIVLMDIAMPDLNGLEAAARLAREEPRTRTIILSMHAAEEYVRQALKAGAAGYVLKDAAPAELELAIRAVARGETFLSPGVSRQVMDGYVSGRGAETPHALERLTPRQREVLQLVAESKSTKDIAFELGLSVKTVETHRAQLMDRLDIHDVAGLVRFAIRMGLVK
jgi:DNA-binding NarL/FixJ family response regulator